MPTTHTTDLEHHIAAMPLVDTHEHLHPEDVYLQHHPDVLQALFANPYLGTELIIAGADPDAVQRAINPEAYDEFDLEKRFTGIKHAWENCRHTGYGEIVRFIANKFFDIRQINLNSIIDAQSKLKKQPADRKYLLQSLANIDHVQIDYFNWKCEIDKTGPTFFLHDISWYNFAIGDIEISRIYEVTGIEIKNAKTLKTAMEVIFEKYAPIAIAVKTQHAYYRTLKWEERSDSDADAILKKLISQKTLTEAEKLCLGDWALTRGIELAKNHNLPFKIHTGMGAGYGASAMDNMVPRYLCGLLNKFPDTKFSLFHIGYPYYEEAIALAKQYPNVYIDMCWAWSFNPMSASEFLRKMIHAIPANKVFAFGGDHSWPYAVVAFAHQARQWINRTLQAEIDDGFLTEEEAMGYASKIMRDNQYAFFDVQGVQNAICSRFKVLS